MNPLSLFCSIAIMLITGIVSYNAWISWQMSKSTGSIKKDSVTGIMKGAEPLLLNGNNGAACLLIHGFIGSPTDFVRLPSLLHKAGFTVSVPLLPGHGTDPRDFAKTTPEDLIQVVQSAHERLKRNHSRVILIGLSMGGALSLIATQSLAIDQLILLAPYLKVKHFWYYLLPVEWHHQLLSPFIPYVYRLSCFKQVYKRDGISQIVDYSYIPLSGVKTTFEIGRRASAVSNITAPTLIIHSKKDKATDYNASSQFIHKSKNPNFRFVTLEKSNHLILWDYEAEQVEKEILDFIQPGGQK